VNAVASPKLPNKYGPTTPDIIFLCFLFVAMLGVGWVGHLAYKEGMKMAVTKRNGEAWAKWFTQAGLDRSKEGYEVGACATGFIPSVLPAKPSALANLAVVEAGTETTHEPSPLSAVVTPPQAPTPRTWGPCFKALSTQGGLLADKFNPFSQKPLAVVAKCDMADRTLAGAMALEKSLPTPPGSAIPFINSPLVDSDSIEQKMQIRVTMCDKGAYPVRIAEIDF
jgi:hypothetical protein